VDQIPNRIEVRDFVREELDKIENHGNRDNRGMCKHVQRWRKIDDSESLEKSERRHGPCSSAGGWFRAAGAATSSGFVVIARRFLPSRKAPRRRW
jgi:hypothetical protein